MYIISFIMTETSKILVVGDVNGQFSTFLKRLENVDKKAGPFDMGLCVGAFFSDQGQDEVFKDLIEGRRRLPFPIYILGPTRQNQNKYFSDLDGYEMTENLIYLGRHGCLTTKDGLRVAYVSGTGLY